MSARIHWQPLPGTQHEIAAIAKEWNGTGTPLLLSGRTTMHGLLVFVSLLGGMAAFGFIGLVIGPVAIAALGTLLEAVTDRGRAGGPEADAT